MKKPMTTYKNPYRDPNQPVQKSVEGIHKKNLAEAEKAAGIIDKAEGR